MSRTQKSKPQKEKKSWFDAKKVESDSNKYPVVGRFTYDPNTGIGAELAIENALKLISDLKAGRVTPVAC